MLSAANKEKRCVFAKSTVGFNWLHVVPCDEVTVTNAETANQHNDIEWLPENEKPKPRATVKFPISESRFAAVTSEGGVTLIPCTANPTAPECQKLLETALPLIEAKSAQTTASFMTTCLAGRLLRRKITSKRECLRSSQPSSTLANPQISISAKTCLRR